MTKKQHNRADELTYHALVKAVEADKLRIYLDYGKINRPLSPVYNPWETLLPILLPILLGLILIIGVGVIFGLLFIIGMILVYSGVVKKKLYQRIIARTKVNADNKKSGCVAPEGDWKEFVVKNFADLMIESKPAAEAEEKAKPDEKAKR